MLVLIRCHVQFEIRLGNDRKDWCLIRREYRKLVYQNTRFFVNYENKCERKKETYNIFFYTLAVIDRLPA